MEIYFTAGQATDENTVHTLPVLLIRDFLFILMKFVIISVM
jgi:hypothetical protein